MRLVDKTFERLCKLAFQTQRIVKIDFFFVKATKKEMRELSGGKQTLQRCIHVASVANVVQATLFRTPERE
jgi:hypothetical protein